MMTNQKAVVLSTVLSKLAFLLSFTFMFCLGYQHSTVGRNADTVKVLCKLITAFFVIIPSASASVPRTTPAQSSLTVSWKHSFTPHCLTFLTYLHSDLLSHSPSLRVRMILYFVCMTIHLTELSIWRFYLKLYGRVCTDAAQTIDVKWSSTLASHQTSLEAI